MKGETKELAFKHSLRYPWEEAYLKAILETNNDVLAERIWTTEAALRVRLVALTRRGHEAERSELEKALRGLDTLKRERVIDGTSVSERGQENDGSRANSEV